MSYNVHLKPMPRLDDGNKAASLANFSDIELANELSQRGGWVVQPKLLPVCNEPLDFIDFIS